MENSIRLSKLERQLLLYDSFYYLENVERQDISSRLPMGDRMLQRDFTVLCRIGYPIIYIREIGYYAMWCENGLRDDFGVFLEKGVLKREWEKTDLKLDRLAEQWPQVKEKMTAAKAWQWWMGE